MNPEFSQNNEQLEKYTDINEDKFNTLKNLNDFSDLLNNGPISNERLNHITNYVINFAEIESKYSSQKQNIKDDVKKFINMSLSNNLDNHFGEYNIKKFDSDNNTQIDKKESDNYTQDLTKAITQIVVLGGLENFSDIHRDSDSKSGFSNADKYIADKINLGEYILGDKGDKNYIQSLIQKTGDISENEFSNMKERKFSPTSSDSWGELGVLLANEFGSGVEDILRFLGNIPSGIVLLPRYLKYRADINSSDIIKKTSGEIKIQELVNENPALGLLDLLGEKGVELIKSLGKMFSSGKQGDIATLMVTIAGLVAGGAGAIRFGLSMGRKQAVKNARNVGFEGRINGKGPSKNTREKLKTGEKKSSQIENTFGKIDDLVGGAGIGHVLGSYNFDKGNSTISNQQVISNSSWLERGDKSLPNKILKYMGLKELTPDQMKVVEKVHTDLSKGIYKNDFSDLMVMTRILREAGITKDQVRVLMENGITGEFKFDDVFFSEVSKIDNKINSNGIQDYLDGFSGKELSLEQLALVISKDKNKFSNFNELIDYLDLYDITPPSNEFFLLAKNGSDNILFSNLLKNPKDITIDSLKYFDGLKLDNDALFLSFIKNGDKKIINDFFDKINNDLIDFDLTKLPIKTIDSILNSNILDINTLGKLISNIVDKDISIDTSKFIKEFLNSKGKDIFSVQLSNKLNSILDMKIDKFNPRSIVKGYLDGVNMEFNELELSKFSSSAKTLWNHTFDSSYDSRFMMIYKGKSNFFNDVNIDLFFNLNFPSLSTKKQGLLYDLIKEGGEYYDKIKGYSRYNEILELAEQSYKKTK